MCHYAQTRYPCCGKTEFAKLKQCKNPQYQKTLEGGHKKTVEDDFASCWCSECMKEFQRRVAAVWKSQVANERAEDVKGVRKESGRAVALGKKEGAEK